MTNRTVVRFNNTTKIIAILHEQPFPAKAAETARELAPETEPVTFKQRQKYTRKRK